MRHAPKVALLVDTSYKVRRDLLLGVTAYARQHGPWNLYIGAGDTKEALSTIEHWNSDAFVAPFQCRHIRGAVLAAGVPTVALCLSDEQLEGQSPSSQFSDVAFDAAEEIARLAAEHFLRRGYRHFAYFGFDEVVWSRRRERAFCAHVAKLDYEIHVYRQTPIAGEQGWHDEQTWVANWLAELPKPIAVLACNDERGYQLLQTCRMVGLHVPEEVAVLGVDNDEFYCNLADPPLSSVAMNAMAAGFRVGEILNGMMRATNDKPRRVEVKAVGVVTRRSTEAIAVEDEDVAAAMRFIRSKHGKGICVDDVAHEMAMSRRTLEKRFRATIGRTILEEIQLVRLERSKQLLLNSSYPVSKVAEVVGFESTTYFIQFFHKHVGKTPRRFRAEKMVYSPAE